MKISIIGATGDMGYGLALRLIMAGHDVCIGSRQAEKAQEAAQRAKEATGKDNVVGMANPDACRRAELAVIAVPSAGHRATLETLKEDIGTTPVLDVTIPLAIKPIRFAPPAEGSNAQETKAILGENSRVASGFHTIAGEMLSDLANPVEGDLLVAGDDNELIDMILELGREMGLRGFNAGRLHHAVTLESLTPMLIGMNRRYGKRHIGIGIVGV